MGGSEVFGAALFLGGRDEDSSYRAPAQKIAKSGDMNSPLHEDQSDLQGKLVCAADQNQPSAN